MPNSAKGVEVKKMRCFVVSPIGDDSTPERAKQKKHANTVLKTFIRPALKGFIDDVVRADEISEPGDINRQVLERLAGDDLVIADLSFHNPNVFYELAIRHMLGKPYVQMINKDERIPFDVGQKRTIKFDLTDLDALEDTRDQIRKQAEACLAPGFRVETPLGTAVAIESLKTGDASERSLSLILERLDALTSHVVPWQERRSPEEEALLFAGDIVNRIVLDKFPDVPFSKTELSMIQSQAIRQWSHEDRKDPAYRKMPTRIFKALEDLVASKMRKSGSM